MRAVTYRELVDAVRGRPIGVMLLDVEFERVETDSRRIRPGDVFWALKGPNHDGHDHLAEAAERGAVAYGPRRGAGRLRRGNPGFTAVTRGGPGAPVRRRRRAVA